ncbi:alpha/beta fold hydrolase [Erythrobacter sp. NFXS35]|uniref:alpha/beta fold hydrolase n=1 Tax=Erythrobacter sp. NFXS35 TaxID=2818436 RepID=UPI0032E022A5
MEKIPHQRLRLSDNIEIFVRRFGPESGPIVLMIHGAAPGASGWGNFCRNVDAFVAAGYHVIVPDLPGFGDSAKPAGIDYDLPLFTGTMQQMLCELGIERIVAVGNSMGGAIANNLAITAPDLVSALIVAAPHCLAPQASYWAMPGVQFMIEALTQGEPTREKLGAVLRRMVCDPEQISDALLDERWQSAIKQPADVMTRLRITEIASQLHAISCPVLAFWGAQDEITPSAGALVLAERVPQAEVIIYSQTGHWPQFERHAQFNERSLRFLDETRKPA